MTLTKPPVGVVPIVVIAILLPALISGNGVWTPWNQWSTCSKTCVGGVRQRTRNCDSSAGCTGGSGNTQTQSCNNRPCTASWGEWGSWSICSTCINQGKRYRKRYCYFGNRTTSTKYCDGDKIQSETCVVNPCGALGQWGNWSSCYGCGTAGYMKRYRSCDRGCNGSTVETGKCNTTLCRTSWMAWNPWGLCSRTDECGWGTQRRTRKCPDRENYECIGNSSDIQNCITTLCGVIETEGCEGKADIVFVVDASASIGLQNWFYTRAFVATVAKHLDIGENKTRLSVVTYGDDAKLDIKLNSYFNKTLMMHAISGLPYAAGRTNTQGGLAVARTNVLTAANGERPDAPNIVVVITDGESNIQPGNTIPEANRLKQESNATVIVIGITEGVNEAELRGMASDPDEVVLSSNFSTLASIVSDVSELTCQEVEPVEGDGWAEWGNWSKCSKLCNVGHRIRRRDCKKGYTCDEGSAYENKTCNIHPCPDGWAEWGNWSECSKLCNVGHRIRRRECKTGYTCDEGPAYENETCNIHPCPDGWAEWENWGECSKLCDIGHRIRRRDCKKGYTCDEGTAYENETCNIHPCPVRWTEWGKWSECSKLCNVGQRIRGRDCMPGYTCDEGSPFEYELCNIHPCPVGPCGHRVDLALVVDSSASVGGEQWDLLMDHIYDLVDILDVSSNGARVAMIQYSTSASIIFDLSTYTDKEDVLSTLQSVSYFPGATNTQEALRLMRTVVFGDPSSGDRKKVPNVCVLYTGGGHNIEPENTYDEAMEAKADGIYVIAVGATPDYNRTVLQALAYDEVLVYAVENITLIAGQIGEIANMTCKLSKKTKEGSDCDSSSSSSCSSSSESDEDKKNKEKKKDKGGKDTSKSDEDKKKKDKKKKRLGKETESSESDEAKGKGKGNKKAKGGKEKSKKGGKCSPEDCDNEEEKAKGKDRQKKGKTGGRDTRRKAENTKRKGAKSGSKERRNQKKGKTGNDKGSGRDREGRNNKKKRKDNDRRGSGGRGSESKGKGLGSWLREIPRQRGKG